MEIGALDDGGVAVGIGALVGGGAAVAAALGSAVAVGKIGSGVGVGVGIINAQPAILIANKSAATSAHKNRMFIVV